MAWKRHSADIYTLVTNMRLPRHRRPLVVAFRLDGRGGEGYRVDMAETIGSTWLPFEAIDGGQPVATLAIGKRYVAAYVRLARAQNDLTVSYTKVRAELGTDLVSRPARKRLVA